MKGDIQGTDILQFACREDNYGYLLADRETGRAAAIDTPDVDGVLALLRERSWSLAYILNTHWHEDHCGGNIALKKATGACVVAPASERLQIPAMDIGIQPDAVIMLGRLAIHAIDTAGHTKGHLSYHVPDADAVFTGDALFTMGCGRLFEGTAEMAWAGLERLAALPDETAVYCAHEYGNGNAAFALTLDAGSEIDARATAIRLNADMPTVPSSIGLERQTNPFLRLPMAEADPVSRVNSFGCLRVGKDRF